MIELSRPQLSFAEGLIQEEVGPLWEQWMRPVRAITITHPIAAPMPPQHDNAGIAWHAREGPVVVRDRQVQPRCPNKRSRKAANYPAAAI